MVCRGKEASSLALGRSPAGDRPVTGIAGYFGVASIKFWLGLRDKRRTTSLPKVLTDFPQIGNPGEVRK